MPITPWGNNNLQVQDAPNDPSGNLQNGYQSSSGAANPEPLDFYLWSIGTLVNSVEAAVTGGASLSLNGLSDVQISGVPNDSSLLSYNAANSRWEVANANTFVLNGADIGSASAQSIYSSNLNGILRFRGIRAGSSLMQVTSTTNDVVVNINVAGLLANSTFNTGLEASIQGALANSVHAQHSTGRTVTVTLPSGGLWSYILFGATHNSAHPLSFLPGARSVSDSWDGDEEENWSMAGTSPGGSSWTFIRSDEDMSLSLIAVRVA